MYITTVETKHSCGIHGKNFMVYCIKVHIHDELKNAFNRTGSFSENKTCIKCFTDIINIRYKSSQRQLNA